MSGKIRGMVSFGWLLEDGGIEPDVGDKCLQEEDGKFLDDASQFTTKMINYPEDYDISDNLADWTSDEEPPEAIAEGCQDAVQLLFISISLAL